jgi:lipoprotein-releasing system ATP-binding protein
MSNVLALSSIVRHFPSSSGVIEVLKNASLGIAGGEMVALVGPSGSGKSTLLQIAGLLDTPQSGEIRIVGVDASRANDASRTHLRNQYIGFIYQFHNLLPELTAEENVAMPQRIAGFRAADAHARSRSLLTRLGLEHRLDHLPSQLSGGEQQRVAIARALANKPALILADEPTGNLDPETSDSVVNLLLKIAAEEKVAALIATHNMAVAKRLTRAVTVRHGAVEAITL